MDLIAAQTAVVQAVAACCPAATWQAAILDVEILEFPDGYDLDYVGVVLLVRPGGALRQDQFYLDPAAREACTRLYAQRRDEAGEVIAGFVLRIEQPGTYRFDIKTTAKRLNGVWDATEAAYLDNYLASYQREKAAR